MIKVMSDTPKPLGRSYTPGTPGSIPRTPGLTPGLTPTNSNASTVALELNIPSNGLAPTSSNGLAPTSSTGTPRTPYTPAHQQLIKDNNESIIFKDTIYEVENFGEYNNEPIKYIYTEDNIDYEDINTIYIQFSVLKKIENKNYLYKLVKDDYYIIVKQDPDYKTKFLNVVTGNPIKFTIIGDDIIWNSTHKNIKSLKISEDYKNKVKEYKQETSITNPRNNINETLASQDMNQGMTDSEKRINRLKDVKKLIKIIKINLYTNNFSTPQEKQENLNELIALLAERDKLYKEIEENMLKNQLEQISETFKNFDDNDNNKEIKDILKYVLNVHQIITDKQENINLDNNIEKINNLLEQNNIKEAKELLKPILIDQINKMKEKLGVPSLGGKRRHRKTKKQNRKSRKTTKKSRKSTKRNGNFNIMPAY
jgi:hypothetical protein